MEPLRYQWYKDDRRINAATADSPNLIIAEAGVLDAGAYMCEVRGFVCSCLIMGPQITLLFKTGFACSLALSVTMACSHTRTQVTNKDGADVSTRCVVKLDKLSRRTRASGMAGGHMSRDYENVSGWMLNL